MKQHQMYKGSLDGTECSRCGATIKPGFLCVKMEPATVQENGQAKVNATATHGVLCMGCYEEL